MYCHFYLILNFIVHLFVSEQNKDLDRTHPETDDEGIEKDSGDCDDDTRRITEQHISLDRVLQVKASLLTEEVFFSGNIRDQVTSRMQNFQ